MLQHAATSSSACSADRPLNTLEMDPSNCDSLERHTVTAQQAARAAQLNSTLPH